MTQFYCAAPSCEPGAGQTWRLRSNPTQTVLVERVTRGMVFTSAGRFLRKTWHERFAR